MLTEMQKKVLDSIDEAEVVSFGMALTDIYSPTGSEAEAARFCFEEFHRLGLRCKLQEVAQGRCNAVGELPGTGGGLNLMFNGHLDISNTTRELHIPGGTASFTHKHSQASETVDQRSTLEDGWIRGNGIRNMKSAHAAYFGAVSAIMKAGVRLKGNIMLAAVCGEIEKTPVDDYQGQEYRGYGEGTRFLVTHGGGLVNGCILGEPTSLRIMRGNFGTIWLKLSTRGDYSHTAWADQVDNGIEEMARLLGPLRAWIEKYRNRRDYFGVRPQGSMSAIQGGWPWRLSRTPTYCNLYLDVRYIPGMHPLEVKDEIDAVIAEVCKSRPKLEIESELLITVPPAETPADASVVQCLTTAHRTLFDKEPEESFKGAYTDASHLTAYGIPTVIYGPAGRNRPGVPEYVYGYQPVDDLMNATRVYALAALDFCMRERHG